MRTVRRLHDRFSDKIDAGQLEAQVRAMYARFDGAPVQEFVPILVEREVRSRLGRLTDTA